MIKEVKRPWGNFIEYVKNKKCTVKIITVNTGGILSKQFHKKREEFWVVLDDGLVVEIGKKKFKLKKGQEIKIKRKMIHRVFATKKARFLEISFGEFDEKDIVRVEDKYGRK